MSPGGLALRLHAESSAKLRHLPRTMLCLGQPLVELEVMLSMVVYSPELRFHELHNLAILPLRGSWAVLMARWEGPMTVSALGFLSTVSPHWAIMLVDTGAACAAAGKPSAPHWVAVPLAA